MFVKITKNAIKSLIVAASVLSVAQAHGPTAIDWDYSAKLGPGEWSALAPEYRLCASGKSQSPINISQHAVATTEKDIEFHYSTGIFGRVLDKHDFSVEVIPGGNEYITLDGERYDLQGLHFHAPAEHQIARITYPLEVHFIHKNSQGKLLVVGVFFQEGKVNKNLQKLFAVPLPKPENNAVTSQNRVVFDPTQLIPKHSGYFVYSGSLTTPPCTEGVTWLLMKKILNASSEQLEFFRSNMIHGNARPIQPLNQRVIYEHSED
ncbi:MAG TPA: carbonic anhydrase family protein [Gammaproteobacteria bacterium]|nr:carbonic anhydrase family protein [Gammaproteobacteria bacterium]